MRQDMKDLLLDTGRHGGYGKSSSRRARFKRSGPDDLPSRISSSRHRIPDGGKSQGDRLRPLKQFLEANCGRPWDDVYSEICEFADTRTIRGYHLRQHVWQYVLPNNYDVGHKGHYGPFFVDDDGTLQKEREKTAEDYARERAEYRRQARRRGLNHPYWDDPPNVPNPRIVDDADYYWEKIEGIWYAFETEHFTYPRSVEDLVEENGVIKIVRIPLKDGHESVTTKRQVNGKIRKELEEVWANQTR